MTIGYDKLPINHGILLDLTFEEMIRLLAHDRAKPHHIHTLHGTPTWSSLANGLPYLNFNSMHPDWLDCPAADTVDLDFTSGDFSIALWLYTPMPPGVPGMIMGRGEVVADGWYMIQTDGVLMFATSQAGAVQTTDSVIFLDALEWRLVGVSRSGASARIFGNGEDITLTPATHIDPRTSNRELHIGISDNEIGAPLHGKIAGGPCGPRIWGRKLEALEMRQIFEQERHWFGV